MNNISYLILVIAALSLMIFITRAIPFIVGKSLQHNKKFKIVGQFLPAYIMLLLTIYEIQPSSFIKWPFAIPAIIGLCIMTLVHLWRRQVLLSLVVGTVVYMGVMWLV